MRISPHIIIIFGVIAASCVIGLLVYAIYSQQHTKTDTTTNVTTKTQSTNPVVTTPYVPGVTDGSGVPKNFMNVLKMKEDDDEEEEDENFKNDFDVLFDTNNRTYLNNDDLVNVTESLSLITQPPDSEVDNSTKIDSTILNSSSLEPPQNLQLYSSTTTDSTILKSSSLEPPQDSKVDNLIVTDLTSLASSLLDNDNIDIDSNIMVSPILLYRNFLTLYTILNGDVASNLIKSLQLSGNISESHIENYLSNIENKYNQTLFDIEKLIISEDHIAIVENPNITDKVVVDHNLTTIQNSIKQYLSNLTKETEQDQVLLNTTITSTSPQLIMLGICKFSSLWHTKFENVFTTEKFEISLAQYINVTMMQTTEQFNYVDDDELNAKILDLPYHVENKNISMIIILPKQLSDDIPLLLRKISLTTLKNILMNTTKELVHVKLPKFDAETTYDLLQVVNSTTNIPLRINNMDESLKVDHIIHKIVFNVNENGFYDSSPQQYPTQPIEFTCNHRFIFFIYDKSVNSTLIGGIIGKPETS